MFFLGLFFMISAGFSGATALFWVGVAFMIIGFIFDDD